MFPTAHYVFFVPDVKLDSETLITRQQGLESLSERGANMKNTWRATARILLTGLVIAWVGTGIAEAQWEPYPWKNMPRTADGKVDLNALLGRLSMASPTFPDSGCPLKPSNTC